MRVGQTGYLGRVEHSRGPGDERPDARDASPAARMPALSIASPANSGMVPMIEDGIDKVKAGVTTIEEVLRVTREVA